MHLTLLLVFIFTLVFSVMLCFSVMFNLYLNNVLITLKQSGLGCHINGTYMGALGYADDSILTCPSLNGLNSMLDICYQFAKNNHVIFNTKKTIKFV